MSNMIVLKLSMPDSDAYAQFSSVEGLDNQKGKSQSLTFIDGEVHRLEFIRFLGGFNHSRPAKIKLEMTNIESVMAVWNFTEVTLIDYILPKTQKSEQCIKVQSLQFSANLL